MRQSFLRADDLSGRTVIPFVTHGGHGLGNSIDVVTSLAHGATMQPALEADQERRTLETVSGWMRSQDL